ncbi:MAG TPA: hypothetical protein VGB91_03635 [Rhizomicrobium sp.]
MSDIAPSNFSLSSRTGGVRIERVALGAMVRVTLAPGRRDIEAGLEAAFAASWPASPNHVMAADPAIYWFGPGDWLVQTATTRSEVVAARLSDLIPADGGSAVAVGDGHVGYDIGGRDAAALLASACPLDLDRFASGRSARTLFAGANVLLHRRDDEAFRLLSDRTLGAFLQDFFAAALREFS